MLMRIVFAATRTFFVALRLTFAALWIIGVLVASLISRFLLRRPEELTRDLHISLEGWQTLQGVTCSYCGSDNDETAPVCYRCGAPLPRRQATRDNLNCAQLIGLSAFILLLLILVISLAL